MASTGVSTESFAQERKADYKGPRLKVAIIGCGSISETQLKAFEAMPDVEIVAGADTNPPRLEVMKDKYGISALYADYHKMLKEIKPDAVTVCTPNAVHAPATIASLKAGAHVITEKPMAMSPKECQSMMDAAAKAKRKLAVGFQYRFHPATQMLRRARDQGQFGKVMFVKCQALRRRGIPNWGVFGQKHLQGGAVGSGVGAATGATTGAATGTAAATGAATGVGVVGFGSAGLGIARAAAAFPPAAFAMAATSSPGLANTTINPPTGTFSPSFAMSLATVPGSKASNSCVALSVSTSAITSPGLICSFSFFSHFTSVPSVMVSESFGMVISIGIF